MVDLGVHLRQFAHVGLEARLAHVGVQGRQQGFLIVLQGAFQRAERVAAECEFPCCAGLEVGLEPFNSAAQGFQSSSGGVHWCESIPGRGDAHRASKLATT